MRNSGFINIGYGNIVASGRIIAIVSPEAAPVKRLVQEAKAEGNIIDATLRKKDKGGHYMRQRTCCFVCAYD